MEIHPRVIDLKAVLLKGILNAPNYDNFLHTLRLQLLLLFNNTHTLQRA